MWFKTSRVLLTSGVGEGCAPLSAFDCALREARIADFNLIRVSSIVPSGVPVSLLGPGPAFEGDGAMVPAVYEELGSSQPGEIISVGVGVGVSRDRDSDRAGIIFTASSAVGKADVEASLAAMVAEGMERKGLADYELIIAASEVRVAERSVNVVAAAMFVEPDLLELLGIDQSD